MKNKSVFLLVFVTLFGCHQNEQKKNIYPNNSSQTKTDSSQTKKKNHADSLFAGRDTLMLNLKIDSADQHITIPVKVSNGNEIFASLSSNDKNANIRINQIGLPDSTFDGPFGKDFHYKIKMPGIYQLIIAEDMMAGDRWKGNFLLKVWVE
jgi:hypothetical protein